MSVRIVLQVGWARTIKRNGTDRYKLFTLEEVGAPGLRPAGRATRIHAFGPVPGSEARACAAPATGRRSRVTGGGPEARRSYKLNTAAAQVEDRGRRAAAPVDSGRAGARSRSGPGGAARAGTVDSGRAGDRSRSGGADRAGTQRAGVHALLDWHSLPGRVTSLLRLE